MGTRDPKKTFLIRLSSKGLCFVCLRDIADADQRTGDPCESRLRNITNFLGINQKKILEYYFTCELSKCEGVKVKLCQGCSELMEKFDSLYKSLELTRLKLSECVWKIHSLIDEAERDNNRVEEMKQRVTHAPTAGVLDEMRRKVLEKSLRALEVALPRVVVERMTSVAFPNEETLGPGSEKIHDWEENTPDEEPSDDDQVSQPEPTSSIRSIRRRRCQLSDSEEWKPPRLKVKGDCRRKTRLPCPNQKKKVTCPHCSLMIRDGKGLVRHTAIFHSHQYFLEHRLPSVSSEQFQNIVSNALFKGMIKREGKIGRCAVCSKQLSCDNGNYSRLRIHLVQRHFENLVKKLMELQKDPDILNGMQLAKEKSEASSLSKFSCPHCMADLLTRYHLNRHLVNHHLETFFAPEEKFKDLSLSSHQYKQILHHLLFNENVIGSQTERKKCRECDKTFFRSTNWFTEVKVHMIQNHYYFLIQKMATLQKDPELQQKLARLPSAAICKCGAYFVNMMVYKQHQTEFCKLLNGSLIEEDSVKVDSRLHLGYQEHSGVTNERKYSSRRHDINPSSSRSSMQQNNKSFYKQPCPHCRAVIGTKRSYEIAWLLDAHILRHHLETYFPEKEIKQASLTSYQFKQVLTHLLFEYIGASAKLSGPRKCPHCPRIFKCFNVSSVLNMKRHLIKNHHKQLTQRLRKLQNDPDLLDKLERTDGFPCKCGAYYAKINLRNIHQSGFCNLLGGTTSNGEANTETSGSIPNNSTGLEVDDGGGEDESFMCIPYDSAPEHGRDPLELEHETGQVYDDEPEPEERDLRNFEIDVEGFVYVAKVEEESLVKIERKRRGSESVPESDTSSEKLWKLE